MYVYVYVRDNKLLSYTQRFAFDGLTARTVMAPNYKSIATI